MVQIRPLSSELAQRALDLFQETDNRKKMILLQIKKWLLLQPHLKIRMDDQWLIAFARGCKYSFEDMKKKLEDYYTLKTKYPEVYGGKRDPQDSVLSHFIKSGTFLVYNSKTNPSSPTIMIGRIEYDYTKYSLYEAVKYETMLIDVSLYENDNLTINGAIEIFDLKNFSFSMFAQITVDLISKLVYLVDKRLPISFKGFHYINPPLGYKTIFEICKLIAGENLLKRVFVHDNFEDLYKYVPKAELPKEYGGDADSLEEIKEMWINKFETYRDWLIEDEQFCVDENLRAKNSNDLLSNKLI